MLTDQQKQQMEAEQQEIRKRIRRIKHQIVVMSGKGGVGKSTVAVNLAISLAAKGKKIGLLDIDIHGPSIPHILGLTSQRPASDGNALLPVQMNTNLKVISIGFMLENQNSAVIWRGPMKYNVIKQFLKDVAWGDLDFLIADSPPGTGDEPLSVVQLLERVTGGIIVTTPQDVALNDVRKSITFCRKLNVPVLGVVENMSGFVCPKCGTRTDIFKTGGGRTMANEMGVPFLGSVPVDPRIVEACDMGTPYVAQFAGTDTAKAFERIVTPVLEIESETSG
jgi:Mrp family chromosome partitioning ATPase